MSLLCRKNAFVQVVSSRNHRYLDSGDLSYYRPIVLNPIAFSLVSTGLERAVHAQLLLYINDNDLFPSLQSVDHQFID